MTAGANTEFSVVKYVGQQLDNHEKVFKGVVKVIVHTDNATP